MNSKTVNIPLEVYHAIEEQLPEFGFESVDEYITFILQELLKDDAAEESALSPDEEEKVERRLRDLGYL